MQRGFCFMPQMHRSFLRRLYMEYTGVLLWELSQQRAPFTHSAHRSHRLKHAATPDAHAVVYMQGTTVVTPKTFLCKVKETFDC